MTELHEIIAERGNRYGAFAAQAEIAVHLKESLRAFVTLRGTGLRPDQIEALDMILLKISRLVNGDPNHLDGWRDIAGYATLVADRIAAESRPA